MSARLKSNAFTIVELLIVIVVLGVLVSISVLAYGGMQKNARDASVLSDVDALDGIQTEYGLANGVAGKAWYSGSGVDSELKFTPSPGNVIDAVIGAGEYCIRGYHPNGTKNSITNSQIKESIPGSCIALHPSVAAGGSGGSSLLGWWKLNGSAIDSSGNNKNGTAANVTPTTDTAGRSNSALSFNGTNSYIDIAGPFTASMDAFTTSAWYKTSATTDQKIFSQGFTTHMLATFTAGQVRICGAATSTCAVGGPNTSDGNWHFVVATGDATSSRVYLDGSTTPIITRPAQAISLVSNAPVAIGRGVTTVYLFNGAIDDVRFYNRAITTAEIQTLYDAGPQ